MYENLYKLLTEDVRYIESVNACMGCGICTAICPAAEFYDYDPRNIVTIVQSGNKEEIIKLLETDTIWYCGQCMSCKTRCPRGNCPGLLINVLRKISQVTGAFTKSKKGRQQYLIKNSVGANIIKYGYCIYPDATLPETHPEQGTVWKWVFENKEDVYASVGANYNCEGSGTLRKISEKSLEELRNIFKFSGGFDLFNKIENFSNSKAIELGFTDSENNADMEKYKSFVENE
ncbi:MAG: 4Fe-4S dicluster domain-containing protein [Saprospiraceae bacterium]|nr:4Fe-4S dicluster domain-containing protein [Saprospiraceae bacterium]